MECFLFGYNDAPLTLLISAILSLSDSLSFDEDDEEDDEEDDDDDDDDDDDEEGNIAVTSVKGLDVDVDVDVMGVDVICSLVAEGRVGGTGVMDVTGSDDTVTETGAEPLPGVARNHGVWVSDEGVASTWGDLFFFKSDCTFCPCPCTCPNPCT